MSIYRVRSFYIRIYQNLLLNGIGLFTFTNRKEIVGIKSFLYKRNMNVTIITGHMESLFAPFFIVRQIILALFNF